MRRDHAAALLGAAVSVSQQAPAHAFTSGVDFYAQVIEGSMAPLSTPGVLILLLALGLLVRLWQRDGMVHVWPGFIAGLIIGGIGAVCAMLAALSPPLRRSSFMVLATFGGVLTGLVVLKGHNLGELPRRSTSASSSARIWLWSCPPPPSLPRPRAGLRPGCESAGASWPPGPAPSGSCCSPSRYVRARRHL